MAEFIKAPKGTKDVIPREVYKWHYVENVLKETAKEFGFSEIRFPVFEHTELFLRGVGDTTDIVQKEMYTFNDKAGRSITLRPEGTASVVRAYLENSIYAEALPAKMYYIVPNFRYEKPQAGRLREHHQFGVECFGAASAAADAEVISLADSFLKKLGIVNVTAHLNSIGCPNCRPTYNKKLKDFLEERREGLCDTCKERLDKNPMRVLDCKSPICQDLIKGAPVSADHLCDECNDHFEKVKVCLESMNIDYSVDTGIVRGLDYYTKTVFEFISNDIGAQGTVCAGGRYDGLVEQLAGPSTPGLGFGCGIERLIMVMEALNLPFGDAPTDDLYIAVLGEKADLEASKLSYQLRKLGLSVTRDLMNRSLKAQMKFADKLGAKFTLVIGDGEIETNNVTVKNMVTGDKLEVKLTADEIKKAIKGE